MQLVYYRLVQLNLQIVACNASTKTHQKVSVGAESRSVPDQMQIPIISKAQHVGLEPICRALNSGAPN